MMVNQQVGISAGEEPQSNNEAPEELSDYQEAFEEFECKCTEACKDMECFDFERKDFECPICHAGLILLRTET